ncbi:helix-turn-helix domain-containing protein [Salinispirillum sp. LH 10-3-1]|uniref:Helix-turn-helix domain-containing protein n=1 Tax=Salinispirillum sp. LH 10-3-1 TaxID=2952525 RepID=A0AB38YGG8_9GAMM
MSAKPNPSKAQDVPQFVLYGEAEHHDTLEFLHLEPIATRSRSNGWVIKAHRHARLHQLILVFSGAVTAWVDEQEHHLDGACCISLPPGIVHGFRFAPETQGVVLTVAQAMVTDLADERTKTYLDALFAQPEIISFSSSSAVLRQLHSNVQQMMEEFRSINPGRQLLCEWLLQTVLLQLSRCVATQRHVTETRAPETQHMQQLRALIEAHFTNHWKVEDYARTLNMPPARLNRMCKTIAGKNAKALLQERLLLEARRKLIYTRATIEHIAFDLGYADPAYFSRVFQQAEGVSPKVYRQQHDAMKELEDGAGPG